MENHLSKEEILNKINTSEPLTSHQKDVLKFLLESEHNFLTYAIGEGDVISTDWDYLYTELKTYLIPFFLESDWLLGFGETHLDEYMFIIYFEFNKSQKVEDLVSKNSRLKHETKTQFNIMELYLNYSDMKVAYNKGLIKDTPSHNWLIDE